MIADQVQERLSGHKVAGAIDGVTVAQRVLLLHKSQPWGMLAGSRSVGGLVTGTNHHADLLHAGPQGLFHDDTQYGFLSAIAIDQRLQRQGALAAPCRGDDGFGYLHGFFFVRDHRNFTGRSTGS